MKSEILQGLPTITTRDSSNGKYGKDVNWLDMSFSENQSHRRYNLVEKITKESQKQPQDPATLMPHQMVDSAKKRVAKEQMKSFRKLMVSSATKSQTNKSLRTKICSPQEKHN